MNALGPLPAALLTNSASLCGLIFLVALLNIDKMERTIELTVRAGDHSEDLIDIYSHKELIGR